MQVFAFVTTIMSQVFVAYFLVHFFENSNIGYFGSYLLILSITFSLWLLYSLFGWLGFLLSGKREITNYYYDFFCENSFPRLFHPTGKPMLNEDKYLYYLYNSDSIDPSIRVQATAFNQEFVVLDKINNMQLRLRMKICLKEAIKRYFYSNVEAKKYQTISSGPYETGLHEVDKVVTRDSEYGK